MRNPNIALRQRLSPQPTRLLLPVRLPRHVFPVLPAVPGIALRRLAGRIRPIDAPVVGRGSSHATNIDCARIPAVHPSSGIRGIGSVSALVNASVPGSNLLHQFGHLLGEPSRSHAAGIAHDVRELSENLFVIMPGSIPIHGDECRCRAAMPYPTSSADALHVDVHLAWQVVVENVAHATDVKAARCEVGGHHDLDLSVSKLLKHLFPLMLFQVSMKGAAVVILLEEFLIKALGLKLRVREDQQPLLWSTYSIPLVQKNDESVKFLVARNLEELLSHSGGCSTNDAHTDKDVLEEILHRHPLRALWERGREHQGLPLILGRHPVFLHDFLESSFHSHVQHAVRLI
mmetsp:Transcript_4026/g.9423  ORF Transcript_4026/g.9423 Transcript_4026/m.9423 type:complete len:345 (+) Transcript_4026:138-1172(+)